MENRNVPDAEMAVLGAAMIDFESAKYLSNDIPPEAFYFTPHQIIAESINTALDRGIGVDIVTVSEILRESGKYGEAGGGRMLLDCLNSISTTKFLPFYSRLVLQAWYDRQIEARAVSGARENAAEIMDLSRRREAVSSVQGMSIREATLKVLDGLDENYELWKTGIFSIDEILGGVEPGDLTTIAARTGCGKTATLVSLAIKMASQGKRVVFFAGEMGPEQVAKRALSNISGVDHWRIRTRKLDLEHLRKLGEEGAKMSHLPIQFSDLPSPSLSDVRGMADAFKADVIFVDYLTRCRLPKSDNYRLSVNAFMVGLKNFARESRRYVVLAAQIGRGIDGSDKKPNLSDIKESSAIEEESDQVILLHMDEAAKLEKNTADLTALVAKNRHGRMGIARLAFHKATMRVE